MNSRIVNSLGFCSFIWLCLASTAWGWGSRGHTVVTRVAVRQLLQEMGPDRSLSGTFLDKESVLSHLSLVPDIVWRSGDQTVSALNSPMHYYDLEYVAKSPRDFRTLPESLEAQAQTMEALCQTPPEGYLCPAEPNTQITGVLAGSAPFRIAQLYQKLTDALREAKNARQARGPTHPSFTKAVNEALLYGGLLSHYVADLANPYHVTRDYDGYEHHQGGVHEYFEQTLVNELDLSLDSKVLEKATKLSALTPLKKRLQSNGAAPNVEHPQVVALGLMLDSFDQLPRARELDRQVALIPKGQGGQQAEKGLGPKGGRGSRRGQKGQAGSGDLGTITDQGLKIPATRHAAQKVRSSFEPLITDRLAIAAAVLTHLWRTAWAEAGRPDLRDFRSFEFPVAPAFFGL